MRCKSVSSVQIDPYEAGTEIGEALRPIEPEAILLFVSVHYADFSELFEGIYDGLDNHEVIIFGGTGDGVYETSRVENIGVCALGFNTNRSVTWTLSIETGIAADSFGVAQRCAQRLKDKAGKDLQLSIIMAGMSGDGNLLTSGIRSVLSTPCVGGLTGDDRRYEQGIVLANGRMYEDAVALLGMSGNVSFELNSASGWKPMGQSGTIEKTDGVHVSQIGGKTAVEFINQQFGQKPTESDIGVLTMALYQDPHSDKFATRTPFNIDQETGVLSYFASIEEGTTVKVCYATRDDVINGVYEALNGLPEPDFEPAAAFVISCAGRKWILGNRTKEEVERILPALPKSLPLIGLPAMGEIAPLRLEDGAYSGTYFHNVTYIITLIGSRT